MRRRHFRRDLRARMPRTKGEGKADSETINLTRAKGTTSRERPLKKLKDTGEHV